MSGALLVVLAQSRATVVTNSGGFHKEQVLRRPESPRAESDGDIGSRVAVDIDESSVAVYVLQRGTDTVIAGRLVVRSGEYPMFLDSGYAVPTLDPIHVDSNDAPIRILVHRELARRKDVVDVGSGRRGFRSWKGLTDNRDCFRRIARPFDAFCFARQTGKISK
jgi:hypothetical protein